MFTHSSQIGAEKIMNEITITKAENGFVVKHYPDGPSAVSFLIASNEAELRVQVMKLMEKLYPDPIYADDFVAKEAK